MMSSKCLLYAFYFCIGRLSKCFYLTHWFVAQLLLTCSWDQQQEEEGSSPGSR